MKRTLIILLVVVIAAGWLGTIMARDPGYVLIAYGGMSLQTGLWVFLGLLVALNVGVVLLLRSMGWLLGLSAGLQNWRQLRRQAKGLRLSDKGMALMQEGAFQRAEKFLISGAELGTNVATNYIAAARAADAQDHLELRERYLRLALEHDPKVKPGVSLAEAQMHLGRREWRKALASIEGIANNPVTLDIRKQALLALRDWQGLADIMADLRKNADDEASQLAFEKLVAQRRFSSANNTDESLEIMFNGLPGTLRNDPELVLGFCRHLKNDKLIEARLRSALKHHWHDELVAIYGQSGKETLNKRLKTAESWRKEHPDSWALHACLGQLYDLNGEKDKAKDAFNTSLQLQPSVLVHERLAKLLAFDGDYAKSSSHLRQALQITDKSARQAG